VKTPSCRGCGRVLIDGAWRYQINVTADEIACCPSCLRAEEERDELIRRAQMRRTVEQIRNGFGPAPEGVVWNGFREGE
jgi:hypothetical protein